MKTRIVSDSVETHRMYFSIVFLALICRRFLR